MNGKLQETARVSLGLQCPECYGVHIKLQPRQPHDPYRFQCEECGCQWTRCTEWKWKPRLVTDKEKEVVKYNFIALEHNTRNFAPALMEQLDMTYGRPSRAG